MQLIKAMLFASFVLAAGCGRKDRVPGEGTAQAQPATPGVPGGPSQPTTNPGQPPTPGQPPSPGSPTTPTPIGGSAYQPGGSSTSTPPPINDGGVGLPDAVPPFDGGTTDAGTPQGT